VQGLSLHYPPTQFKAVEVETKEPPKEQLKEQPKEQPKEEPKEQSKEQPKEQSAPSTKKEKGTATPASKASSPKPARSAKETPQLPQGSGFITNALFGGVDESAKSPGSRSTPNIIVHVPLNKGNQIVNFARLAEEQYGFAALHPRLAAHKARLARVAAAGAALEKNDKAAKGISADESADEDLSMDAGGDSDADGDVAMGGTGTGTNGAPSETSDGKKKRRKKVEEYDRDDPFVDDSEMVWQEQAAASKDGFFVYSGPLVPEGEKVQVERYGSLLYLFMCIITNYYTEPTAQSNAAVGAAGEQAEVDLWFHIHMFQSLRLCLFLKIPVYHCVDLGLGVAHRVVHGGIRRQRARSISLSEAERLPPPHRKAVVAVAVPQPPTVAEAIAIEVERRLRLRLQTRFRLQTLLLHPQPRILHLCRLVLALWLVLS
jgi:hypothetical protein